MGLAVDAAGRVVLAGSAAEGGQTRFALARYTTAGAPDTSFGPAGTGRVTTPIAGDLAGAARAVALAPGNRIVLAGYATAPSGYKGFAVARYTDAGALDPTFGVDGTVFTGFNASDNPLDPAGDDLAHALAVQPDGKIVLAGSAQDTANAHYTFTYTTHFALARYLPGNSLGVLPAAPANFGGAINWEELGSAKDNSPFNKLDGTWTDQSAIEQGFRLERSLDGTTGWETIKNPDPEPDPHLGAAPSTGSSPTYTLHRVLRKYRYRLRAYNAAGESAPSNVIWPDFIAEDVSLPVEVEVGTQPAPHISFAWPTRPDLTLIDRVFRKRVGDQQWQPLAPAPGATSYTDWDVTAGSHYEYRFHATGAPVGEGLVVSHVYAGLEADHPDLTAAPRYENRGKVVLLVEEGLVNPAVTPNLVSEVARLREDLAGDGWTVVYHTAPRHVAEVTDPAQQPARDAAHKAGVAAVKNMIQAAYDADPARVKAVFLLGHVPVPYAGFMAPDLHSSDGSIPGGTDHFGAWPADAYYGDVAGMPGRPEPRWTDDWDRSPQGLVPNPRRPENRNVAGDGKFDQSDLADGRDPELAVGRVDLAHLPMFGTPEVELLRRYLDKDHAFRHGQLAVARRAVIDNNLSQRAGTGPNGFRNFYSLVGPDNVHAAPYGAATQDPAGYLWAYADATGDWGMAPGVPNGQQWAFSEQVLYGVARTSSFVPPNVNTAAFHLLYGSYIGDWDSNNSLLRAPLAADGNGLTAVWGDRPSWYFHHMGLGEPIGRGVQATLANVIRYTASGAVAPPYQDLSSSRSHLALMGDPTLRMHAAPPPQGMFKVAESGGVHLYWDSPAIDPDIMSTWGRVRTARSSGWPGRAW